MKWQNGVEQDYLVGLLSKDEYFYILEKYLRGNWKYGQESVIYLVLLEGEKLKWFFFDGLDFGKKFVEILFKIKWQLVVVRRFLEKVKLKRYVLEQRLNFGEVVNQC